MPKARRAKLLRSEGNGKGETEEDVKMKHTGRGAIHEEGEVGKRLGPLGIGTTEITSVQLTEILAVLMDIRRLLEHSGEDHPELSTEEADTPRPPPSVKSISYADPDEECPKCGGEMVMRTSKHGEFLGCSHYPECKGTRKV